MQSLTEKPGALSSQEQAVAVQIEEKTMQKCVITKSYDTPGIPSFDAGKIWDKPTILKLYSDSEGRWWKADILYNSVWDSVYFEKWKRHFVCGDKQWAQTKFSSQIVFTLVAPK